MQIQCYNSGMKIQRDENTSEFKVNSFEPGHIVVNKNSYHHSVVLSRNRFLTDWQPQRLTELSAEHLAQLLELQPEVILLGTGTKIAFPPPHLLAPIYQANIGIEIMDTSAACRTFNLLVAEDRNVVAALIIE